MPRLVFSVLEEFLRWIRDNVKPDRYSAYFTDEGEVLLVPLRSTRPILYAYFKGEDLASVKKSLESLGVKFYEVQAVEWADDRPVGFKWKEIE